MPSSRAVSSDAGWPHTGSRLAALDDSAIAKDEHLVREFEALFQAVGDQQDRNVELGANVPQNLVQLGPQRSIQPLAGSSSSSMRGRATSDRASEQRCRCPPDS